MIDIMKKTAVGAVENTKPVIVQFGTVMSLSPLEVLIEQKITLGQRHIICSERRLALIEEGHRLVLLRIQGGQRYYIAENLDKEEQECECDCCQCEDEEDGGE